MFGRGSGVRPTWVYAAAREMQLLAGQLAEGDAVAAIAAIDAARSRVPDPRTPIERCLLDHFLRGARLAALPRSARAMMEMLVGGTPAADHRCPAPLVQARRLLETRFIEPWTVQRLARQVGSSSRSLARGFRLQYGVSVHAFVTTHRLRAAALLLTDEHWKIEAVSALVGYKSKKNFYAEFRKTTGVTPAQFRLQCRGEISSLARSGDPASSARHPPA